MEYHTDKQSSGDWFIEAGLVGNHAFLKALKAVDSVPKENLHIRLACLVNLESQSCNLSATQEKFLKIFSTFWF